MCFQPFLPRHLQLANDVEENPGPLAHKLVRPPLMTGRDKKQPLKDTEGLQTPASGEDLRFIIERQNDQILKQNEEIKTLKKKIDDNDKVVSDFKYELSEVRKKWQSMGDLRAQPR